MAVRGVDRLLGGDASLCAGGGGRTSWSPARVGGVVAVSLVKMFVHAREDGDVEVDKSIGWISGDGKQNISK